MYNKEMEQKYSIIIVGGGLAGLTLASTFVGKNIPTLLIDSLPNPNTVEEGDRRTTALMESSVNFIKNIGVWDADALHATPLETMNIYDIKPLQILGDKISFHAKDVGRKFLAQNVNNHALRLALCNKISTDKNIQHLFNTNADHMEKIGNLWSITANEILYKSNLVIGADGRSSFCRKSVGIKANIEEYNQTAIVFNARHSASHNNSSTEFMYPEGAFTFVPMDNNESAIVWVEKTEVAKNYIQNKEALFNTFVRKSQGYFGNLEIISNIQTFPCLLYTSDAADE